MSLQRNTSRAQVMPPEAWEAIRTRFTIMYLEENKTLCQIMDILAQGGFRAS